MANQLRSFRQTVQAELQDKEYEGEEAKEWSLNIADTIREGVKALNVPRQDIAIYTRRRTVYILVIITLMHY